MAQPSEAGGDPSHARRGPSADDSWDQPYDLAIAPTASLPIASTQLAAGSEIHHAMVRAALPGVTRVDDATPIVNPLPRQRFPTAPRAAWYRRWQIVLGAGAAVGVTLALLTVGFSDPPAATASTMPPPATVVAPAKSPQPTTATPAAKPAAQAAKKRVATGRPAAKAVAKAKAKPAKKPTATTTKKKPPVKRPAAKRP